MNTAPASPQSRVPLFDNLRLELIVLVIMGHVLELFKGPVPQAREAYIFIYSFHIPLFAFVSGAFADRAMTAKPLKKLLTRIVAPLVVFEVLYSVAYHMVYETFLVFDEPATPYKHLWFLVSLAFWRLSLFVVPRRPWAVAVAFVAGLAVGYADGVGEPLSASRTIVLYPFYLLGASIPRAVLSANQNVLRRALAAMIVTAAAAAAALWGDEFRYSILFGKTPYAELGLLGWSAALHRLAVYAAATCVGAAIVILTPRRRFFFTALGARTMAPYLLHQALVLAIVGLHLAGKIQAALPGWVLIGACLVVSAFVAAVLSTRLANLVLGPLCEPSPRQAVAAGIAAVAFAGACFIAVPSIRYASARVADVSEVGPRTPVEMDKGGVAVFLIRARRNRAVEMTIGRGVFGVTFFRQNRPIGSQTIRSSGAEPVRLDVPAKTWRKGYDLVLITPSGAFTRGALSTVSFR